MWQIAETKDRRRLALDKIACFICVLCRVVALIRRGWAEASLLATQHHQNSPTTTNFVRETTPQRCFRQSAGNRLVARNYYLLFFERRRIFVAYGMPILLLFFSASLSFSNSGAQKTTQHRNSCHSPEKERETVIGFHVE